MRLRTIAKVPLVVLLAVMAGQVPAFSVPQTTSQSLAVANLATIDDILNKWRLLQINKEIVTNENIVKHAEDFFGIPYCRGGTGPSCYDCSGFTQQVLGDLNIEIPRVAQDQYRLSKKVDRESAMAGDLVFFFSGNYIYHVGIYIDDNLMIHSPKPGRVVKVENIWSSNVRFGRVVS